VEFPLTEIAQPTCRETCGVSSKAYLC